MCGVGRSTCCMGYGVDALSTGTDKMRAIVAARSLPRRNAQGVTPHHGVVMYRHSCGEWGVGVGSREGTSHVGIRIDLKVPRRPRTDHRCRTRVFLYLCPPSNRSALNRDRLSATMPDGVMAAQEFLDLLV